MRTPTLNHYFEPKIMRIIIEIIRYEVWHLNKNSQVLNKQSQWQVKQMADMRNTDVRTEYWLLKCIFINFWKTGLAEKDRENP